MGGAPVADQRPRATGKQGSLFPRARRHRQVTDGIDAVMQTMEGAGPDQPVDRATLDAGVEQLITADNAMLAGREPRAHADRLEYVTVTNIVLLLVRATLCSRCEVFVTRSRPRARHVTPSTFGCAGLFR
jgi:hypothetical protein